MIHDKWWHKFSRKNHRRNQVLSYVKTGYGSPKEGSIILFYVTKPVGEVAGYAEFVGRKTGDAQELWKEHGHESVLESKEQYEKFIEGKQTVSFIRFRNLHKGSNPIPLDHLLLQLNKRKPSRASFYVDKENSDKLIALMD